MDGPVFVVEAARMWCGHFTRASSALGVDYLRSFGMDSSQGRLERSEAGMLSQSIERS